MKSLGIALLVFLAGTCTTRAAAPSNPSQTVRPPLQIINGNAQSVDNHVNTRAELLVYDPVLAALCREVFGDTELKSTKPHTRLTGHLAGSDPATAETQARIRAAAQARTGAANAAPAPRP